MTFLQSQSFETLSRFVIASVWVFHGLYGKLCNGIPRHRLIVGRVLGGRLSRLATKVVGCLEVLLGVWAFSGVGRVGCALVQTLALAGMNTLEIILAADLLISAMGMVALNLGFLAMVWHWAFLMPRN